MFSVFDSYASFTYVHALKEACGRPLRKSLRVNTLKNSKEELLPQLIRKNWKLTPVPWCSEGFYVEGAGSGELGRDPGHTLGHYYLQEAASMLPVTLLDPQPGEIILDMAAAPGSKSTQIASALASTSPFVRLGRTTADRPGPSSGGGGESARGILIANDVQERRIWILRSALERSGVTNCIMTKKVGHWFAKHMTERFDRVLCDAPCTALGTVRKGTDAMLFSSAFAVSRMAKLQRELLEAAVHATKVGGRIVYSTCTFSPEENEGIVSYILNKFSDQLEALPLEQIPNYESLKIAFDDSQKVQEWLAAKDLTQKFFPAMRLWPQTYDTEGFFCAVLQKKASTLPITKKEWIPFSEKPVSKNEQARITAYFEDRYGTSFLEEGEKLFERGERLYLLSEEASLFELPCPDYGIGLPFAKKLSHDRILITHEVASLRGMHATKNIVKPNDGMLKGILSGKDIVCDPILEGHVLLLTDQFCLGRGLATRGKLKNNIPRGVISGVLD